MPNPTIKTIAKEAGVSVATVSKALNNMPDISESTKAYICDVAKKQGYTINTNARELARGGSHSVGVVLPDITHPGCAQLAKGLHARLEQAGCALYLNDSGGLRQAETLQTLGMLQKRVAVLVFLAGDAELRHVEETVRGQVPVIYVGGRLDTALPCTVACDEAAGGRLAARHLMKAGHRQCLVFCQPETPQDAGGRVQAFMEYVNRQGGQAQVWQAPPGLEDEAAGAALAQKMAKSRGGYTAVFAASDEMALGAMAVLAAAGMPVPQAVSVVGYGDIPAAALALANLTSVRLPYTEMGIHAGDMAAGWVRGEPPVCCHVLLEPELVKRGSVRSLHLPEKKILCLTVDKG